MVACVTRCDMSLHIVLVCCRHSCPGNETHAVSFHSGKKTLPPIHRENDKFSFFFLPSFWSQPCPHFRCAAYLSPPCLYDLAELCVYYSTRLLTMLRHTESNTESPAQLSVFSTQSGGLHTRKFNLSHMPIPLDTNRINKDCARVSYSAHQCARSVLLKLSGIAPLGAFFEGQGCRKNQRG